MKKQFIMLVGVPGSGKSTYIENMFPDGIDNYIDWVVISSDDVIEYYALQDGITYNEAFPKYIKEASRVMKYNLNDAIDNGLNIIWDQTNLNINTRKGKISQIPNDYEKQAIYFNIPEDLEVRLASRPGKTIPPHVLESMIKSYEVPSIEEGFDKVMEF